MEQVCHPIFTGWEVETMTKFTEECVQRSIFQSKDWSFKFWSLKFKSKFELKFKLNHSVGWWTCTIINRVTNDLIIVLVLVFFRHQSKLGPFREFWTKLFIQSTGRDSFHFTVRSLVISYLSLIPKQRSWSFFDGVFEFIQCTKMCKSVTYHIPMLFF